MAPEAPAMNIFKIPPVFRFAEGRKWARPGTNYRRMRGGIRFAGRSLKRIERGQAREAPALKELQAGNYCAGLFFSFRHISTAEVGSMALPPSMIC